MSQLFRPAIVIALYALLLPAVGPLLDHHYVEWQHNHAHVYFGGGPEAGFHLHVYDTSSGHGHAPATGYLDGPALPEGVAYFSSYDGSGNWPISAPTGPATGILTFPDPGDHPLLLGLGIAELPSTGLKIAPPLKPPTI